MTDSDTAVQQSGKHRLRSHSRLRTISAAVLTGVALIGFGVTAGTASADPTAQDWANIRNCESGGNYSTNTGNGYYGAYQFDLGTWQSMGGSGLPSNASPATQDALALALWRSRGWSPWACASMVSLSNGTAPATHSSPPPVKKVVHTPFPRMSKAAANKYVGRLFVRLLGRPGGANDRYSRLLQAGQTSKVAVATSIAMSPERTNKIVIKAYRTCLSRYPTGSMLAIRSAELRRSGTLGNLYASVCGSAEAFVKAGKNNAAWVGRTYQVLMGRPATAHQKAVWSNSAAHSGKVAVVKAIVGSSTWRGAQLNGIYRVMLGHNADAVGYRNLVGLMAGRGVFSAPVRIAQTPAFA